MSDAYEIPSINIERMKEKEKKKGKKSRINKSGNNDIDIGVVKENEKEELLENSIESEIE